MKETQFSFHFILLPSAFILELTPSLTVGLPPPRLSRCALMHAKMRALPAFVLNISKATEPRSREAGRRRRHNCLRLGEV